MKAVTDERLYYLVVDVQGEQPIYVFVGRDPVEDQGPLAEPVQLELLPPMLRFGRPGRPTFGRPVLGKARGSGGYREFACTADLWEAGFLPVTSYRVCDEWNYYHMPWETAVTQDSQTTSGGLDDSM